MYKMYKIYINKKLQITLLALLFSLNHLSSSTAEEDQSYENFLKETETRARSDDNNFNYFPKLELDTPNLIGGAATLKFNEVFARASAYYFHKRGYLNDQGNLSPNDGLNNHIQAGVQVGWGILDNLLLGLTVPTRYFIGGSFGVSDPWINLKYRIIESPFILSVQAEGKIPVGASNTGNINSFGSGDFNAGGMLLATKSFKPFFIQLGTGYIQRFPFSNLQNNQLVTNQYTNRLNYFFNAGYNFEETGIMIDASAFGHYPLGSGIVTANYLTLRPNVTWKFNNMEINLSGYVPISGLNIDYPIGINAGYTIKGFFEYPKILNLMFSKKIDPPELEKAKDFSPVIKGKDIYLNSCSKCHALVDPSIKTFDEWVPVIDRYREKKLLTKSEHSSLIEFLKYYKEN